MKEKEFKKMQERQNDLMNGQMSNMRANQEQTFFRRAEQEKKDMIKGILKTGYNVPQDIKEMDETELNALSELDKINLAKKLELDNKLREFTNKTSHYYENFEENVLMPSTDKKIQEQIKMEKAHEKQMSIFDKGVTLASNRNMFARTSNRIDIEKQIWNNEVNKKTQRESEAQEDLRKRMEEQAKFEEQQAIEAAKKKQLMDQYKANLDA